MASKQDKKSGTAALSMLLRRFRREMFDSYRPELHYMRGPGPKWREKYGVVAGSTDVPNGITAHI